MEKSTYDGPITVGVLFFIIIALLLLSQYAYQSVEPHDDPYDNPPEWCSRHYNENATNWSINWCELHGNVTPRPKQ